MAVYTINTNTEQEALLSWIVQQANLQKDLTLTNQQYIQVRVPELLGPYVEAYKHATMQSIEVKFALATIDVQQQIKSLLGIT